MKGQAVIIFVWTRKRDGILSDELSQNLSALLIYTPASVAALRRLFSKNRRVFSKDLVRNNFLNMKINSQFGSKFSARNIEPRIVFDQHLSVDGLGLIFNVFS